MKILIAPLNWGLGHASRCVPLVQRLLDEGHEVVLGGDGDSLTLLRKHFPKLRYVYLAPLSLRYGKGRRQVWAVLKALPKLISWSIQDHTLLKAVLREEPFDQVISDNRFGLYNQQVESVYITHQLHIMLPRGWKWAEKTASRLHARVCAQFNKVWVPDYEDVEKSLAGELSHTGASVEYIGPLSRFQGTLSHNREITTMYDVVAVLSGLEPHRSMLEQDIIARYHDKRENILIVQGLMNRPNTRIKRGNITMVPYMADDELAVALQNAQHVIARSGYSTIMDFARLGILDKSELIPTPGQPEQEYLAAFWTKKCKKRKKITKKFGQFKKKQ